MAADSKTAKTIGGAPVMVRIVHGATASTARPVVGLCPAGTVEWVGSVTPTNAVDGDTWINTA